LVNEFGIEVDAGGPLEPGVIYMKVRRRMISGSEVHPDDDAGEHADGCYKQFLLMRARLRRNIATLADTGFSLPNFLGTPSATALSELHFTF